MNIENLGRNIAFVKFFEKEEYLNGFVKGELYCNTPHFYRKFTGEGVGDKSESCLRYWDKNAGDDLPIFIHGGVKKNLGNAVSVLSYPSNEEKDGWLQCWATVLTNNSFHDDIDRIAKECGQYFVFLPAENFPKYIERLENGLNVKFSHFPISYSDNPLSFGLSVKGEEYAYQREYRFIIGECDKLHIEAKTFSVGNLSDIIFINPSLKIIKKDADGTEIFFSRGKSLVAYNK